MSAFGGIYEGLRVLVTGHTGFKGSWLAYWLQTLGAQVRGIGLAPDTTPSHWQIIGIEGVDDVRADLRDADAISSAIRQWQPELIFHLAAQPLVRRSYRDPVETFATNVSGLVNVFEAVRRTPSVRACINATTDKVYAETAAGTPHRETDPLGGHDPYSTSKACAELLTECYRKSYFSSGPHLVSVRAGNVIGGGDWAEDRLIPDMVRAVLAGSAVSIRNPGAIRPWQHVLEPLSGYLVLGQALLEDRVAKPAWNFGPNLGADLPVERVVDALRAHWPNLEVENAIGSHPHEAAVLRLDSSLAARELGWHPVWDAGEALRRTATWYDAWHAHGTIRTNTDVSDYVADAREKGAAWAG